MSKNQGTILYPQRWAILVACCLACASFQLAAMSYSPLLGHIAKNLSIELPKAVQLMTWFMFFSSVSFFIGGPFADHFGAFASLLVSLLLTSFSMFSTCWCSHSYIAIVALRILQGLSVGFCMGGSVLLVMQWFSPEQRTFALGIIGAFVPIGGVLGIVVTPMMTVALGEWKTAMTIISIFPFVSLCYCLFIFNRLKKSNLEISIDVSEDDFHDHEFKIALISPYTWLGVFATFLAMWLMQTVFSLTPTYLAESLPVGLGFGSVDGGRLATVLQIAAIVAPVIAGYISGRFFNGHSGIMLFMGFVLVIFYGALQFRDIYENQALLSFFLFLPGLGVGILIPMVQSKIAESYSARIAGRMNGLWLGVGSFGGAIGLFMTAWLLDKTHTYSAAVGTLAILALVGAILVMILNWVRYVFVPGDFGALSHTHVSDHLRHSEHGHLSGVLDQRD
ncbi:MAG: hypothetical protein CENE_02860 [Candidatus Celerinatantimonas neptuna]|nr:MAG: hypothetical protein CENE_02860 [Candidatus Celerinatantimonas neptuna]